MSNEKECFSERGYFRPQREEYKNELQGPLGELHTRLKDLQELKPCFAFLENQFSSSIIRNGCPVRRPFVTNKCAVEMELSERQEDIAPKNVN